MTHTQFAHPTPRTAASAMALLAERECVDLHLAFSDSNPVQNIPDVTWHGWRDLCHATEVATGAFDYAYGQLVLDISRRSDGDWTVNDSLDNEALSSGGFVIVGIIAVPSTYGKLTRSLIRTPSNNYILLERLIGADPDDAYYTNIKIMSFVWLTPPAVPKALADAALRTERQLTSHAEVTREFGDSFSFLSQA